MDAEDLATGLRFDGAAHFGADEDRRGGEHCLELFAPC